MSISDFKNTKQHCSIQSDTESAVFVSEFSPETNGNISENDVILENHGKSCEEICP